MAEAAPDGQLLHPRQRPHQVHQQARLVHSREQALWEMLDVFFLKENANIFACYLEVEGCFGDSVVLGYPPEELLQEAVLAVLQTLEVITVNHQVESSVICYGRVFDGDSLDRPTHPERSLRIQPQEHSHTSIRGRRGLPDVNLEF